MAKSNKNSGSRLKGLLRARAGEFCVWVVPPSTGKVRKVRLPSIILAAGLFLSAASVSCLAVLLTDYGRLRYQKLKDHVAAQHFTKERDELKSANEELAAKLVRLKEEASQAAQNERSVKNRLAELQSVIGTIKRFGLEKPTGKRKSPSVTEENVGGAEIECDKGMLRCSSLVLSEADEDVSRTDRSKKSKTVELSNEVSAQLKEEAALPVKTRELLDELDSYILLLKTVPLSAPSAGEISSDFGLRRSPFTGRISAHEGLDISAKGGSPIFSTGSGKVSSVSYSSTYGLSIDIKHTDRISTRYAHLRKSFVKQGMHVSRGKLVALAGSTGRSTGPHLHYEVLLDGKPFDPMKLIILGKRLATVL